LCDPRDEARREFAIGCNWLFGVFSDTMHGSQPVSLKPCTLIKATDRTPKLHTLDAELWKLNA
jgi:hypothetical protein